MFLVSRRFTDFLSVLIVELLILLRHSLYLEWRDSLLGLTFGVCLFLIGDVLWLLSAGSIELIEGIYLIIFLLTDTYFPLLCGFFYAYVSVLSVSLPTLPSPDYYYIKQS